VIRHPAYPQEPIDRAHDERDHGFAAYERNPLDAADGLFNRAIWGADHPRGRIDKRGEAQSVTHDALEHVHDTLILPDNATLFVVGDVTPEQARTLAQRSFGDWKGSPAPARRARAAKRPAAHHPDRRPRRRTEQHHRGPAGRRVPARQGGGRSAGQRHSGGSFDSRLNADLRTAKGWAYNFGSSLSSSATGPRVISAGGTVQTDKTVAAMQEVRRILSGIAASEPITQTELDHEKEAQTRAIPPPLPGTMPFWAPSPARPA
jgi:predicted Zn-dependent peptidase